MTKHHRSIESQNDPQMKHSSIYQIFCIALAIIYCCCGFGASVIAQEKLTPEEVAALADSARQLRKEYRDKKTWEHLVSLPGTIVSLPLVIVAKTTETVAGFIYEEKLIPELSNFLHPQMVAGELPQNTPIAAVPAPKYINPVFFRKTISYRLRLPAISASASAIALSGSASNRETRRYCSTSGRSIAICRKKIFTALVRTPAIPTNWNLISNTRLLKVVFNI